MWTDSRFSYEININTSERVSLLKLDRKYEDLAFVKFERAESLVLQQNKTF